jgi:hypothetical protein
MQSLYFLANVRRQFLRLCLVFLKFF